LLCQQLVYWYALLVLDLRQLDQGCSVVAARYIRHIPELIVRVGITCVTYVLQLLRGARGDIRGMRAVCV
jgi:hypothetical protein